MGISIRAWADGEIHYIAVASDRHQNTSAISAAMGSMPSCVEYVCLDGDMVDGTNSYNSSTILSEVTNVFSSLNSSTVSIVKGYQHDDGCSDDAGILISDSKLIYTAYNNDKSVACYVYGISYQDMYTKSSQTSCTAAEEFKNWVDGLTDNAPIIVCCHIPLHYQRGDNGYAPVWSKALNYAATGEETIEEGAELIRNVVFFHAHNHTTESNYEYYIPQGSTMQVFNSSNSHYTYYTYTTAGYLNANGAATLIAVDRSGEVTLTKYAKGDVSNIYASKGAKTNFSNQYDNSSATHNIASVKALKMSSFEDMNLTYEGVNMTVDGQQPTFTYDSETITGLPVIYTSSNTDVVEVLDEGQLIVKGPGKATITVSFAGNDIYNAVSKSYNVTVTQTLEGVFVLTDALIEGNEYVIANGYSDEVSILGQSNEQGTATVTTFNSADIYIASPVDNAYVWTATADNEGKLYLKNGNLTVYLGESVEGFSDNIYIFMKGNLTLGEQHIGSLSFAEEAITADIYDEEVPTNILSKIGNGTVTYNSSNTTVARVDETTGVVALTGKLGTAVITALMSETDSYTAAEASYILTVVDTNSTYILTSTMTLGNNYIIATGSSGTVTILGQSSGSQKTGSASVVTGDGAIHIDPAGKEYVWTATAHPNSKYADKPRLINNEEYLVYANSSTLSFSKNLTTTSGATYTRYWVYEDGVFSCKSTSNNSTTYYLTYSNGKFSLSSSKPDSPLYLYEKQSNKNISTQQTGFLVFSQSALTKEKSADSFTNTLMVIGDGTITYTSSNPNIATIDENGEVTLTGTSGETTITATMAESTYYTTATASYTLSVLYAKGDVNGDEQITLADVTTLVNYIRGNTSTSIIDYAADVDGDGYIDTNDVTAIINILISK